jgi:hypothetical protein
VRTERSFVRVLPVTAALHGTGEVVHQSNRSNAERGMRFRAVCGATLVFIGLPKIPEPPLPLHAPVGQTGGQRWKIRGSNGRAARLGLGGFLRSCGRGRFPLALGVWVWSGPAACRAVPLRLGVGGRRAWSERGAFCGPHGVLGPV